MNNEVSEEWYRISRESYGKKDYERALKYAQKCYDSEPSKLYRDWLAKVKTSVASGNKQKSESNSNGSKPDKKTANEKSESYKRPYTNEQVKKIKDICSHNQKGDLYAVLGLEKNCDLAKIKRSYRMLALQFHPDRCSAPGTEDAFKAIGFAFSILSDTAKRKAYDLHGIRSTTRLGAAGAGFSPYSQSNASSFSNMSFDDNSFAAAQYIFDSFFDSGFIGDSLASQLLGFGGPNLFFSSNRGFRFTTFPNRSSPFGRPQPANNSRLSLFLIFVIITFLYSYIKELFSSKDPSFSFSPTYHYNQVQTTKYYEVIYWVNNREWLDWLKSLNIPPTVIVNSSEDNVLTRRWESSFTPPKKILKFESFVTREYLETLTIVCQDELRIKAENIAKAKRWFRKDKKKLDIAEATPVPTCASLDALHRKIRKSTHGP